MYTTFSCYMYCSVRFVSRIFSTHIITLMYKCFVLMYIIFYGRCFSSQVTADLMNKRVQRHRKLQRAANQRSKLQDPSIRLAVFNHRRTSDSTTHSRRSTPLSHSTTPDNQQQTVFRYVLHCIMSIYFHILTILLL